uniref:Fatty acid-binding protein 4, adipocyte n=1 Tax=Xenopus tropicalis TaxID=8364 RepID=A0A803K8T3_XENTR
MQFRHNLSSRISPRSESSRLGSDPAFGVYWDVPVNTDVGLLIRKTACTLKPDVIISVDGDIIKIRSESTFKNHDTIFKLNEEFDEVTADGRKTKTTVTLDDGVLVQHQKWNGKESKINREAKDDQMVTTCIIEGIKAIRIYKKKN